MSPYYIGILLFSSIAHEFTKEPLCNPGDHVWLSTEDPHHAMARARNLMTKFIGPFAILTCADHDH
jgi:hypothetical protein